MRFIFNIISFASVGIFVWIGVYYDELKELSTYTTHFTEAMNYTFKKYCLIGGFAGFVISFFPTLTDD
jgi:hypothetical protein